MPGFKSIIKRNVENNYYTDYFADLINDKIIINVPFDKATEVSIGNKKYGIKKGKAAIPFSKKKLRDLMKNGFSLSTVTGLRQATIEIPGSSIRINGEGLSLDKKTYYYSGSKIIKLSDINCTLDEFSFSYEEIAGASNPTEFLLLDSRFKVKQRASADENGRPVFLLKNDDGTPLKSVMQLVAIQNDSLIPLVAENQSISSRFRLVCRQNKVLIDPAVRELKSLPGESLVSRTVPLYKESSDVEFCLKDKSIDTIIASARKAGKIHFFWKSYLTSEERDAESYEEGQSIYLPLSPFLNQKRRPFDREILMYSLIDGGKEPEKGFVHISDQKRRTFAERILASGNGNRIICDRNKLIILENEKCYADYEAKWRYDFSKCSFKTDVTGIVTEKKILKADVRISSLLLPVSSVLIMAKGSETGRIIILEEIVSDFCTTKQQYNISIDLTELAEYIEKETTYTLLAGVRYTGDSFETDSLYGSPEDFKTDDNMKPIISADSGLRVLAEKDGSLYIAKAE